MALPWLLIRYGAVPAFQQAGFISMLAPWLGGAGVTGDVIPPEPEPEPPVVSDAAPGRGFDEYMEAFARERVLERQARENDEIMQIVQFEEELVASVFRRLLGEPDDAN